MRTFEEIQDELRECISHAYRDEIEDIQKFGGNTEYLDKAIHLLNELEKKRYCIPAEVDISQERKKSKMTIEEAITRYENNAEYERTHGNLRGYLDFITLAEWLKDYKQQTKVLNKIRAEIERSKK